MTVSDNEDPVVFSGPDRDCLRCVTALGLLEHVDLALCGDALRQALVLVQREDVVRGILGRDLSLRRAFLRALLDAHAPDVRKALTRIDADARRKIGDALCALAMPDTERPSIDSFDPAKWDVRRVVAGHGSDGPLVALALASYFLERQAEGLRSGVESAATELN